MADERLQQLRRAWEGGDQAVQIRLLRERMRAGELSEDRLRLAGYLGDRLALAALDVERGAPPVADEAEGLVELRGPPGSLDPWAWSLRAWGAEVLARATLAYHAAVGEWLGPFEPFRAPNHAEILACPVDGSWIDPRGCSWCGFGSQEVAAAAESVVGGGDPTAIETLKGQFWLGYWREDDLQNRIRDELVSWALGLRDSVAERVAAREAADSR